MLRVLAAVAALAIGATVVLAQNAAGIAARKDAMKSDRGGGQGARRHGEGRCSRSSCPSVQASLKTIQETAAKAKGLFGDDTKTGETDTLPAAFEKKADVMARFDKLAADAKAAEGAIKDEASFKAEWPKVVSNCGGCHKEYRKPPAAK